MLLAHAARTFPRLAAVVLNGDVPLDPRIARLIEGAGSHLPVIRTELDTYPTTAALTAVHGRFTADAVRKLDVARALFREHVDGDALLDTLHVARSHVVTPLMFELQLADRAREARGTSCCPRATTNAS